ncbi:MAG: EF-P lysine aminoacylase EpmA [Patescibacteria group bacterium]|jgi:lysyl-tRNA synthetase class 2
MKEKLTIAQNYSRITDFTRQWFKKNKFLEVATPELVAVPSMEPYLTPFKTEVISFKGAKKPAYLIMSPEYAMKRLLADGFEKIFQITSAFRNEEDNSPIHNLEFKILEWYRVNTDYMGIAKDTENLIYFINKQFNKSDYLNYQNKKINLTPPWEYITCEQAFKKYANTDLKKLMQETNFEEKFYKIFLTDIERKLGQDKPTFLTDYPASMAALSKKKNEFFAERFELYIAGIELANAFSELTDWQEQFARLEAEREERNKLGKEAYPVDMEFIAGLKKGLPPCGGIALGVDRLIMLLTNKTSLEDVILFPTSKMFY